MSVCLFVCVCVCVVEAKIVRPKLVSLQANVAVNMDITIMNMIAIFMIFNSCLASWIKGKK